MTRKFYLACLAAFVAGVCGCSGGPTTVEVEGTVTFENKPIPEGDITFIPADPNSPYGAEGGKIKDGKYKFPVREGAKKVEIRAVREVPGQKDPMGTGPLFADYIPAQYNDSTTLTADVGKGKTTFDFPLKSKP